MDQAETFARRDGHRDRLGVEGDDDARNLSDPLPNSTRPVGKTLYD
jgi:hypothetical protein